MMRIQDFKNLIINLPVRQQSGTTKRDVWSRFEKLYPWVEKINNQIFNESSSITLSRQDIFNSKNSTKEFILKTILWGYLRGMRGNNFYNILDGIDQLETFLRRLQLKQNLSVEEFEQVIEDLPKIKGIGVSTFSKLLYFSNLKVGDNPCLILDKRLINVLSSNRFEELQFIKQIEYGDAIYNYTLYLETLNKIAKSLNTESENIEVFLYTFGNNLKE